MMQFLLKHCVYQPHCKNWGEKFSNKDHDAIEPPPKLNIKKRCH